MLRRLSPPGPRALAACAAFALLATGCAPSAATFTSARTLPEGKIEGGAFVDLPLGVAVGTRDEPTGRELGQAAYPITGGTVQYGLLPRLQIGARLGTGLLEANSLVQLWACERFALALGPRFQTGAVFGPHVVRAPLIASVEPSERTSIALRAGLGYAFGHNPGVLFGSIHSPDDSSGSLNAPVLEFGACGVVWVSERVGLSLDGYLVSSFLDPSVLVPGGGFAVLFGAPRRPAPK